jgi:hypothetical protein
MTFASGFRCGGRFHSSSCRRLVKNIFARHIACRLFSCCVERAKLFMIQLFSEAKRGVSWNCCTTHGTLKESIMSPACIGLNYIASCKLMFVKSLLRLSHSRSLLGVAAAGAVPSLPHTCRAQRINCRAVNMLGWKSINMEQPFEAFAFLLPFSEFPFYCSHNRKSEAV